MAFGEYSPQQINHHDQGRNFFEEISQDTNQRIHDEDPNAAVELKELGDVGYDALPDLPQFGHPSNVADSTNHLEKNWFQSEAAFGVEQYNDVLEGYKDVYHRADQYVAVDARVPQKIKIALNNVGLMLGAFDIPVNEQNVQELSQRFQKEAATQQKNINLLQKYIASQDANPEINNKLAEIYSKEGAGKLMDQAHTILRHLNTDSLQYTVVKRAIDQLDQDRTGSQSLDDDERQHLIENIQFFVNQHKGFLEEGSDKANDVDTYVVEQKPPDTLPIIDLDEPEEPTIHQGMVHQMDESSFSNELFPALEDEPTVMMEGPTVVTEIPQAESTIDMGRRPELALNITQGLARFDDTFDQFYAKRIQNMFAQQEVVGNAQQANFIVQPDRTVLDAAFHPRLTQEYAAVEETLSDIFGPDESVFQEQNQAKQEQVIEDTVDVTTPYQERNKVLKEAYEREREQWRDMGIAALTRNLENEHWKLLPSNQENVYSVLRENLEILTYDQNFDRDLVAEVLRQTAYLNYRITEAPKTERLMETARGYITGLQEIENLGMPLLNIMIKNEDGHERVQTYNLQEYREMLEGYLQVLGSVNIYEHHAKQSFVFAQSRTESILRDLENLENHINRDDIRRVLRGQQETGNAEVLEVKEYTKEDALSHHIDENFKNLGNVVDLVGGEEELRKMYRNFEIGKDWIDLCQIFRHVGYLEKYLREHKKPVTFLYNGENMELVDIVAQDNGQGKDLVLLFKTLLDKPASRFKSWKSLVNKEPEPEIEQYMLIRGGVYAPYAVDDILDPLVTQLLEREGVRPSQEK